MTLTIYNYYFGIPYMSYGKERRKFIKDMFVTYPDGRLRVNCKYQPQLKDDPDLRKLIRTGFLKVVRDHLTPTSAMTYVVKV